MHLYSFIADNSVLRIARLELKRSRRKYGRVSVTVLVFVTTLAILVSYCAAVSGIDSDRYLYRLSGAWVDCEKFTYSGEPDIRFTGRYIFLKPTDRSFAAADELLNFLKKEYRQKIEEEFGEDAYPVLVRVEYVGRQTFHETSGIQSKAKNETESKGAPVNESRTHTSPATPTATSYEMTPTAAVTAVTVTAETAHRLETGEEYIVPEDLKAPSLLEKLVVAIVFIAPSYFAVQVFSSSLLEDKTLRRMEVLLSAVKGSDVLLGKLLPYVALSIFVSAALSVYFQASLSFIFVIPVVLLLASAHSFVVVISRSYRESTFLLLVVSLSITIYAFIPAVFSGAIPISQISPITLMLDYMAGRDVSAEALLLSFSHILLMSAILLYLSSIGLRPDIVYGGSVVYKIVQMARRSAASSIGAFAAAALSIPFAFMVEFFLLIFLFILPMHLAVPVLILCVAIVEEFIKGVIIAANGRVSGAAATAVGFFVSEKALLVFSLAREYSLVFLGQFLILPLILHVVTALTFLILLRYGFDRAFAVSALVHFIYNYVVVMTLAG